MMLFDGFFDGRQRLYWLYLAVSAVVGLLVVVITREPNKRQRFKAYLASPDLRIDLSYYPIIWAIKLFLIVPFVLSAQSVALWTLNLLNNHFEPLFWVWRYKYIVLLYTGLLFLLNDFSRYWLHRLMHTRYRLWIFHRVHHSAQVLNPITFYRLHPVENLLFALRYALIAGVLTGVFMFCFGSRFDLYTAFGSNIFVVVLFSFLSNLRHSHIKLSYGYWLEHLLISPMQHQIHHSASHTGFNHGSCLALWDWMFGTLKCSRECTALNDFGLGPNQLKRYNTPLKILLLPISELITDLKTKRQ